ncbi:MAG: hypothetical protein H6748_17110 [Spirochaetaceae bacterium]|nr:hypothetical protein [Myxococcales bacterium]MCB9725771.1 hypothetical protein [Spirochaetaceae bacterium]HPG25197.1 hypothetical protein [Myxococcota bacterium]
MMDFEAGHDDWLGACLAEGGGVELELGTLIAAASGWTEDELELDDFVTSLVDTGRVRLAIG